MFELRYHFNPVTAQPHIYDHGVSESEVEDVLARPIEVRKGTGKSRVALGQSRNGRFLKIFYVPDDDGIGIFIITAYDIVGKPLHALRRRMRRRAQ
jgi:hypothetical protein